MAKQTISNQVFVGCPWKNIRPKYLRATDKLKKISPLSFVLVGRESEQDADDLFEVIKQNLLLSSYAIFDVTSGNANVSLEYGFALASSIPNALYLCVHKAAKRLSKDSAIISDLQGKRRKQYSQEIQLQNLLKSFCQNHPYQVRYERFCGKTFKKYPKGKKKSARSLGLKIIHCIDGKEKIRRDDLIQDLLAQDYTKTEIEQMLNKLHKANLIKVSQGRYADVVIA